MLTLLKNNSMTIGATASEAHFDSTIALTRRQLRLNTLNLAVDASQLGNNLVIDVTLENLTGHKFPTGYPARRAWIHLLLSNAANDTVFESGAFNSNGEILSQGANYFNHSDTINNMDDVQVYQAIMGDVNGATTKTLLRAASYLKDNRIPPKGFSSAADNYQDIAIRGNAEFDPDFNQSSNGTDQVTYVANLSSETSGTFTIKTEVLYQSIDPADIAHLREHNTDKVQTFLAYYDNESKLPEIIKSDIRQTDFVSSLTGHNVRPGNFLLLNNYPNPFNNSTTIEYRLNSSEPGLELAVFDLQGKKIKSLHNGSTPAGEYRVQWHGDNDFNTPVSSGIYLLRLKTTQQLFTRKLILLK